MPPTRRDQFGLATLLAAATVAPLWFFWAEAVVNHIEETKRSQEAADLAVRSQDAPPAAVVFEAR